MTVLLFQNPMAWLYGMLVAGCVLGLFAWIQRRSGHSVRRVLILTCLRGTMLLALIALTARPVWTSADDDAPPRDHVVILFDRSESMSLRDGEGSRYEQALSFARSALLPALTKAEVHVTPVLFADEARIATGDGLAEADTGGKATNLARAIATHITDAAPPPLAIIALTDGIANVETDNQRAVSKLVTYNVPFVGLGFGSETGGQIVSLEGVSAPAVVSPNQHFRVGARLRFTGERMSAFDLLLLRDGQLVDRRRIDGFSGARIWQESFELFEDDEGAHTYSLQLMPPADATVKVSANEASQTVRVVPAGDLRVLYLQGGLTWDYKFIQVALRNDPAIKLSGLSRTASTSRFFENAQNDIDLVGGFPDSLEKLGEFRVIILSNLRPGDLSPHQQELLARFCGELGGGVLMIGGPETFHSNWRGSRLEQLLPVEFNAIAPNAGRQPFSVRLTEAALRHPVFQISDQASVRAAWSALPTFSNPASVASVKPGAEVWMEHSLPAGGQRPVLMATQRFGNGVSSVICMQNFWRWRLARQSNTDHYDRFWQQLLWHLSEAGRETVSITFRDQRLQPGKPVDLTVERLMDARAAEGTTENYQVVLTDQSFVEVGRRSITLEPGQSLDVTFEPERAGTYTATVERAGGTVLNSRSIDIREISLELVRTAVQMSTLRQWAGLSGGFAERADECTDLEERLETILHPDADDNRTTQYAVPAGINGWSLAFLVSLIGAEWFLRKRWSLI